MLAAEPEADVKTFASGDSVPARRTACPTGIRPRIHSARPPDFFCWQRENRIKACCDLFCSWIGTREKLGLPLNQLLGHFVVTVSRTAERAVLGELTTGDRSEQTWHQHKTWRSFVVVGELFYGIQWDSGFGGA